MPSTYTLNNGIELIATGEQSGTWGDTTNTNLSLVDTALDGQVTVTLPSAGTSGSPNTLAISDGAASDGRNRMVIFNDGGDLGATAYVQLTPNDAEKIIYVRNDLAGSRSIILFQGTYNASNDYELPAGTTAVIYFDGAGSGAVAANVFNNAYFDSLRLGSVSVTEIIDDDTMATAAATNIATSESIKAYVDAQVGANNELSEVLANGNTTGGTDISVSSGDDITFADSSKAIFGAGSDLQIYHDGNSWIKDLGAGNLIFSTDGNGMFFKHDDDVLFEGYADGAVNLYYDNALKLATTSTGVDITGTLTSSQLTVSSSGTANSLTLTKTDTNATKLVAGNTDGTHTLEFNNGGMFISDTTGLRWGLSSDGDITFYDTSGNASFVYDESAGSTFNENGDNKDFRVESSTSSHMLFVDASAGRVAIGTSDTTSSGNLIVAGSAIIGRTSTTTGDFFSSGGGNSASYNGIAIMSNSDAINAQSNTSLSSWIVDVGGRAGDGITFPVSTADAFSVRRVAAGGTYYGAANYLQIDAGEAVFNEDSNDQDFRVESNSNTHALFVDAGNNRVVVGNSSPVSGATLNIWGQANSGSAINQTDFFADVLTARNTDLGLAIASVTSNTLGYLAGGLKFGEGTSGIYSVDLGSSARQGLGFYTGDTNSMHRGLYINEDGRVLVGDNLDTGVASTFEVQGDTTISTTDGSSRSFFFDVSTADFIVEEGTIIIREASHVGPTDLRTNFQVNGNGGYPGVNYFSLRTYGSGFASVERIRVYGNNNGNNGDMIRINSSDSVIINENSYDADFRVESDNQTHMLFVDAGNDRVEVKRTDVSGFTPNSTFDLLIVENGTSNTGSVIQIVAATDAVSEIGFSDAVRNAGLISFNHDDDSFSFRITNASGGYIFNDDGVDADFRIESDGDSNAFFMNAASTLFGIKTNTPYGQLQIYENDAQSVSGETIGKGLGDKSFIIEQRHSATDDDVTGYLGPILEFRARNDTNHWTTGQIIGVVDPHNGSNHDGGLAFYTNQGGGAGSYVNGVNAGSDNNVAMIIDHEQQVTKQRQVAFFARPPTSVSTDGNTIIGGTWGSIINQGGPNTGSQFSSSGVFTAPRDGWYHIHWTCLVGTTTDTRTDFYLTKNNVEVARSEINGYSASSANRSGAVTAILYLNASDYIKFGIRADAGSATYGTSSPWGMACGYFLG